MENQEGFKVHARMIGKKVCLTRESGNFVMVERAEMKPEELRIIDAGGGDIILHPIMALLPWNGERERYFA